MKKTVYIFILIFALLLASCDAGGNVNKNGAVIEPAEFSKETQKILDIIDNEIAFFDYEVDESLADIRIDIWMCDDGEWVNIGRTYGEIEPGKSQLAVRINESSYDIYNIGDEGHTKSGYTATVDFTNSKSTLETRLSHPVEIADGKEIPLWIKLGSDTVEATLNTSDDFRSSDCDTGLAVTAVFSKEATD